MFRLINRFLFASAESSEPRIPPQFGEMAKIGETAVENFLYPTRQPVIFVAATISEFVQKYVPSVIIRRIISLKKIDAINIDNNMNFVGSVNIAVVNRAATRNLQIFHTDNDPPDSDTFHTNSDKLTFAETGVYLFELCETQINANSAIFEKPSAPREMFSLTIGEDGSIRGGINIHYTSDKISLDGVDIGRPDGFVAIPTANFSACRTAPGTTILYSDMTDEQHLEKDRAILYPYVFEIPAILVRSGNTAGTRIDITSIAGISTRAITIYGLKKWRSVRVVLDFNESESAELACVTMETAALFGVLSDLGGVFIPFCGNWRDNLPDFVLAFPRTAQNRLFLCIDANDSESPVKIIMHNLNILKHDCGLIYPLLSQ